MQFLPVFLVALFFGLFCVLIILWKNRIINKTFSELSEKDNSYTFIYEGFSWGPEITSLIIYASKSTEEMTEENLAPENFKVTVTTESDEKESISIERPVLSASFCDIDGNPMEKSENPSHILLSFKTDEYSNEFSPFVKSDSGFRWKNEYTYSITHSKFTEEINITNDPVVLSSALDKIRELELKY